MDNIKDDKASTPPSGGRGVTPADRGVIFSRSECLSTYKWGDDCYGWNYVDTDTLSINQELMPPDTAEQLHFHERSSQFFFVLKGKATFSVDGELYVLKPEQGLAIQPGQKHSVANKENSDLEFILYSSPSTKNDRIDV